MCMISRIYTMVAWLLMGSIFAPFVVEAQGRKEVQNQNYNEPGFALVELFTSEGCSSCPPADEVLSVLSKEAQANNLPIYTVGWHVDYWDRLGWPDPYAERRYSDRQRTYARRLPSNVYTPQMIVNGHLVVNGAYRLGAARQAVNTALGKDARSAITIRLSQEGQRLNVSYQTTAIPPGSQIGIVVVESNLQNRVTRGENAGRTLLHDNTVRAARWVNNESGTASVDLPEDLRIEHSEVIAFVQEPTQWKIVAATKLPF